MFLVTFSRAGGLYKLNTKETNQRKSQGYRKIAVVSVYSAKTNELGALPLKHRLFFNASFSSPLFSNFPKAHLFLCAKECIA